MRSNASEIMIWAAGFSAALLKKRSSSTLPAVDNKGNGSQMHANRSRVHYSDPNLVEALLLTVLEILFFFILKCPDVNRTLQHIHTDRRKLHRWRSEREREGETLDVTSDSIEANDGEARQRWRSEAAMETRGSDGDDREQTTEREKESERDFAMRERGDEEEEKKSPKFLVEAKRWRRLQHI
ncbi:hypothetical protein Syun_014715 [Stephania yunnanensis]|uniref:Uncharacterized protein n=1 Tax=Stephania yunnanensis TaxID=152371 RepID=A0AAP0PC41_9MAGN